MSIVRIVAIVAATCATSCLDPALVVCADGRACPVGTVCDVAHVSCAKPEQLAACAGKSEGDDCATPPGGGCFDGVCLARGCGNRVVEEIELCDDGNVASDDGCRGDCLSDERCGNGVVDSSEECDDANSRSRDGCDSRCLTEAAQWSQSYFEPILKTGTVAFDSARQVLVAAGRETTMEWDGAQWTEYPHAPLSPRMLVYNAGAAVVLSIAIDAPHAVHEWTAGQWHPLASTDAPDVRFAAVTYDATRDRIVTFLRESDPRLAVYSGGAWTVMPNTPAFGSEATLGYDAQSTELVVMARNQTGYDEWRFSGSSWTASSQAGLATGELLYHAGLGQLLFVSSCCLYEKSAGAWTLLADVPSSVLTRHGIAYDAARDQLIVSGTNDTKLMWNGLTWSAFPTFGPTAVQTIAHDAGTNRTLAAGTFGAWRRDTTGTWERLQSPVISAMTFDRERGRIVGAGPEGTLQLDGDTWTLVDSAPVEADALAFQPVSRELVRTAFNVETGAYAMFALRTPGAWEHVTDLPVGEDQAWTSIAWHARAAELLLTNDAELSCAIAGDAIVELLSPGYAYAAIADARRGTVTLMPRGSLATAIWEVSGTSWIEAEPLPYAGTRVGTYNDRDGALLIVGLDDLGGYVATRAWLSPTPLESCEDGADLDGDGLSGCADDDCFWRCGSCPPLTSC
jgi:cysteine-rich repeat protein